MDPEAIREALHRRPFRPFAICLTDGRRLPVAHAESIAIGKRRVFVIGPDDSCSVVDLPLIISLDDVNEYPPRKDHRSKDPT